MSKNHSSRDSRNYGFGRKLYFAFTNGLRTHFGQGHFATVQAHSERCRLFCDWLLSSHQIADARLINQEVFFAYAAHVRGLLENGDISVSTATNRISSVNVVMKILRGDTKVYISKIGKVLGEKRCHIRTMAPQGMVFEQLDPLIEELIKTNFQRVAAIIMLTRTTGMRLRETILADLPRLKREALRLGEINIQDGCKGGRSGAFAPRWIPATDMVLLAIEFAISASPPGSRNLLSPTESYVEFLRGTVNASRNILKAHGLQRFHDLRAAYACSRYQTLTGIPAPVCVSDDESSILPKSCNREARQIVSRELGHERLEVTNAYLGKKT
ncbi:integrase domain-containing protein [Pseudomonas sp. S9]|uniref:integrase domain-containing protein n=1 Tax=Pseudomonas sp. S9 TaxID=686578 RepID=UPI00025576A7|nr:integrase domain-containing protein [Pseudomonas sp. S9]